MSTVKAVADEVKEVLTEEVIPSPKTHYGISKHQAEDPSNGRRPATAHTRMRVSTTRQ